MDIKEILADAIKKAALSAIEKGVVKEGELPDVLLEVPPQKEFGDFATNFAMQSARSLKCSPRIIAQAVIDNLDCAYVEKAEIAGPGFINFYLKNNWLSDLFANIVKAGENYGNLKAPTDENITLMTPETRLIIWQHPLMPVILKLSALTWNFRKTAITVMTL